MIQVEQLVAEKAPRIVQNPIVSKPTLGFLKRLFHEREVNRFLVDNADLKGFAFVDKVLDHFEFSYQAGQNDRRNIPASGRVMIVANHPLGALDGLALLRLVGEIRPDVRIVANDMLLKFDALQKLFLPVDNLGRRTAKGQLKAIIDCLHNEEAVIIFPAGEVSRLYPHGVKDSKWSASYLKLAQKTNSPVLPIHVSGRNSMLFYTSSWINSACSSLLLAHEMFRQYRRRIQFRVGQPIPIQELDRLPLSTSEKNRLVRRHLYRIGRGKKPLLKTEQTVAHPQSSKQLKKELKQAEHLGSTRDNKQILLFDYQQDSAVMRELGRLREIAFRQVGEGTGQRLDLDKHDCHYRHLILWDEEELEIVGAYRLGEVGQILGRGDRSWVYSTELFEYADGMQPYFEQGIELGRSFVQPKYWGMRSLDYLWQGIGAYLQRHPEIRYMFGPVSLSNSYPKRAKDLLVYFYSYYFPDNERLARSFTSYQLDDEALELAATLFSGQDYDADFVVLKEQLGLLGVAVPTLYKQYSDVCEPGGVRFLDFGVDADFGYCIDGLVLVDMAKLKPAKRKRYLGD